jgi:hypothetical protein
MDQVINFITTYWVWIAFVLLYMCNLLIGKRSQLDSWVMAHPKVGGALKLIRGFLPGDPWLIISGLTLIIKGTLPAKLLPIVNAIEPVTDKVPALPAAENETPVG